MNLSMQTRRAFVTLGLAAAAMVFVMAKTSMGADAQARNVDPVRTETVVVAKENFATAVIVPARAAVPMLAAKERTVRKMARTRCESTSNI